MDVYCLIATLTENGTHQYCKFYFGNGYFKLQVFLELTQSLDVNSVDHQPAGARPYIRALPPYNTPSILL